MGAATGRARRPFSFFRAAALCMLVCSCLAAAEEPRQKPPEEGGTIRGTVTSTGDRPVPNAIVRVSGGGIVLRGVTDDDGAYEVKVPKAGNYRVEVQSAPGYIPSGPPPSALVEQSAQPATANLRLTPLQLVVQVISRDGSQPLGGVALVATSHDNNETVRQTTSAAGKAQFTSLRTGVTYTIRAELTNYEPATEDVPIISASTVQLNIQLTKGSSIPYARSKESFGAPKQLPSDVVQAIFQDESGYVWFATDRGVARNDGTNIENGSAPSSPFAALENKDVRCVAQFGGALWFGTDRDGLWRLADGRIAPVPDFGGQFVAALAADPAGVAWVATGDGLYRVADGKAARVAKGAFLSVVRDAADGSLWASGGEAPGLVHVVDGEPRPAEFARSPDFAGAPFLTALRTRAGDLLFGTSDGAFRIVDGAPVRFIPEKLRGPVRAIAEDSRGNVWFGTDRGVVTYDTLRGVTNLDFEGERVNGLTADREGNLWLATEKGAVRRDLYSFVPIRQSDGLINSNVEWIYPDVASDGGPRLWFATATNNGVQQYSSSAGWSVYGELDPKAQVHHIARDRSGNLWFATSIGVFRRTLDGVESVSTEPASWVAESPDGRIWVAAQGGVRAFDGKELVAVPELDRYVATRVFAIDDAIWLATDHGAVRFQPTTGTVETIDVSRGVQGESVRWVAGDAAGHVWLATDTGGAEVLDARTLKKMENNAGVDAGTDARSLMLDADGFMWVGRSEKPTVRKIGFYEGGVVETVFGAEGGGEIAGATVNAIVQDAAGSIWFATDSGATQHQPAKTLPTVTPRVEVDGRPFDPKAVIPAGQHTIRLLFHGITMLGDVRYLYRMDSEGPWEKLDPRQEDEREAVFPNLPSGAHTFELRALNRDLYGLGAPPAVVMLRIDVHVWNKWWFYGLGLLALGGIALGGGIVYRFKSREYVLPPELRHYVPIEPNPYIVGNPIRNESMFFGREDDFRYVRTKLEGASQGSVVVLCGDRRTGKSSILYQILNGRLGERFVPIFVDLQEMVVANDREFFRRLARLVGEAIHMERAEIERHRIDDERLNPYHQFVDFLDEALERAGDRTLLLLVDEYELLESKVDEGRLDSEIFLFLAGLIDSKERLSFVFTGSRRLEERDRRYWREMLRRSLFRKIGFLSANDARRLVVEPVAKKVVYGRGVVDRITRLTAGQPFYTQVICQTAVDYLNEHERNALTMNGLGQVVAEIVDHPLPQMIYFWDALSPDEKVVLSLLAAHFDATGEYGWASAADLVALVARENAPVDLSENTIHLTLEELFRTEVLEKSPFEAYRFRIDLLRVWIRRSHSIWQVLKAP